MCESNTLDRVYASIDALVVRLQIDGVVPHKVSQELKVELFSTIKAYMESQSV